LLAFGAPTFSRLDCWVGGLSTPPPGVALAGPPLPAFSRGPIMQKVRLGPNCE